MPGRVELDELAALDVLVHVAPDGFGAITSREHCRISVGTRQPGEVGPVVGQERRPGERAGTRGSVRQKLSVSSAPSSGRSGLPMITGAIAADQPRWLPSSVVSRSSMSARAEAAHVTGGRIVDVARGRADHDQPGEALRLVDRGQQPDHRRHRVADEDDVVQVELARAARRRSSA